MAANNDHVVGVIAKMEGATPEQRIAAAVIARAFRDAAGQDMSNLRRPVACQADALDFLRTDRRVMPWLAGITPRGIDEPAMRALLDATLEGFGHATG